MIVSILSFIQYNIYFCRPKYLGPELDLPDILVFHTPFGAEDFHKIYHVMPSNFTEDPKKAGKTRHQQAIDIMKENRMEAGKKLAELDPDYGKNNEPPLPIIPEVSGFVSAGSVQNGEPKTQSCTVNNSEGNANAGKEGQMVEEQREEFMAVWKFMGETGLDKKLKEVIEKNIEKTFTFLMNDKYGIPHQRVAITVMRGGGDIWKSK